MQIPKLAKGGIVDDGLPILGEEYEKDYVFPLHDKYYTIYKRTKNRRIKKKNMRKSFRAFIENEIKIMRKNVGLFNIMIKVGNEDDG